MADDPDPGAQQRAPEVGEVGPPTDRKHGQTWRRPYSVGIAVISAVLVAAALATTRAYTIAPGDVEGLAAVVFSRAPEITGDSATAHVQHVGGTGAPCAASDTHVHGAPGGDVCTPQSDLPIEIAGPPVDAVPDPRLARERTEEVWLPGGSRFFLSNDSGGRIDMVVVQDRDDPSKLSHLGSPGVGPGEFYYPCAIAADRDANLVVADFANGRVQVMTASGQFVRAFGTPGIRPGEMLGPCGLAIDGDGNVYVADALSSRVQVFDLSGRVVGQWGAVEDDPFATLPGQDCCADPGDMIVAPTTITVDGRHIVVVRHPAKRHAERGGMTWRYTLDQMVPSSQVLDPGPPVTVLTSDSYADFSSLSNHVPVQYRNGLRSMFRELMGRNPDHYFDGGLVLHASGSSRSEALATAISCGGTYGYVDFDLWLPDGAKPVWSARYPGGIHPTDRPGVFAISSRFKFQGEATERIGFLALFEWDGQRVKALADRRVGGWSTVFGLPRRAEQPVRQWPVDDDPTWVPWPDVMPEAQPDL